MRVRVAAAALLLAAGLGARGVAQVGQVGSAGGVAAAKRVASPSVSLAFERAGLPVPRSTLTIFEDGTGIYEGEEMPRTMAREGDPPPAAQAFRRELRVPTALAGRIMALAGGLNHFRMECESRARKMANLGTKTLTYRDAEGEGSCTYNYPDDKSVQALTAIFRGMAETMDEGRKLDYLHRYDRLGLDAELEYFSVEVSEGRAQELETIASSLEAIAMDAEVMQRARTRAGALLATIPTGSAELAPGRR